MKLDSPFSRVPSDRLPGESIDNIYVLPSVSLDEPGKTRIQFVIKTCCKLFIKESVCPDLDILGGGIFRAKDQGNSNGKECIQSCPEDR